MSLETCLKLLSTARSAFPELYTILYMEAQDHRKLMAFLKGFEPFFNQGWAGPGPNLVVVRP